MIGFDLFDPDPPQERRRRYARRVELWLHAEEARRRQQPRGRRARGRVGRLTGRLRPQPRAPLCPDGRC